MNIEYTFSNDFDKFLYLKLDKGVDNFRAMDICEGKFMYFEFDKVGEWKSKYGYNIIIYSNDHLIDGKKHFHFFHRGNDVEFKVDFYGNILERVGKNDIPKNIQKEMIEFCKLHFNTMNNIWDKREN